MSAVPKRLGKYEIRREIGKGSMGVVFEAFDLVIQRRVAIKIIREGELGATQRPELIARLRREAQAAGRLNHPGVVAIHDFDEVTTEDGDRVAFIAMELVEGRELRNILDTNGRSLLAEAEAARIVTALLAALQHAHERGVTHRDIKPANVILLRNGDVKLADFGVARIETSDLTVAGTAIGTPSYMSPEQIIGSPVDGRSDLFSCGVVLYELLTGKKPFDGSVTTIIRQVLEVDPLPPSQLDSTLDPRWDGVIAKALAKKPEDRYGSARDMALAIAQLPTQGTDADATMVLRVAAARPTDSAGAAAAGSGTVKAAVDAVPQDADQTTRHASMRPATMALVGLAVVAVAGAYGAWSRWGSGNGAQPQRQAGIGEGAAPRPAEAAPAAPAAPAPEPAPAPAAPPLPAAPPPPPPAPVAPAPVPPPAAARVPAPARAPTPAPATVAAPAPVVAPVPAPAALPALPPAAAAPEPAPAPAAATKPAPAPASTAAVAATERGWEASRDRLRKNSPAQLAQALGILLDVEAPVQRALLDRLQSKAEQLQWKSALAMGVTSGGQMNWGYGFNYPHDNPAKERALSNCGANQSADCIVVMVNGKFLPEAFASFAARLGARPQAETRELLMGQIQRAFP